MNRKTLILVIFALFTILGCAAKQKGPKPTRVLAPNLNVLPGYSMTGKEVIYRNDDVTIKLNPMEKDGSDIELINGLIDIDYIVVEMSIENTSSKKKITYNPSLTTLSDNRLGHRKPLDYTDFYELAFATSRMDVLRNELRGNFYDMHEILLPGKIVNKMLIFKPLEDNAKKANIDIKMIFVGNESINLIFFFGVNEDSATPEDSATLETQATKEATATDEAPAITERGTVKWFNSENGYGYIKRDSGGDAYIHYTGISDKNTRTLKKGDVVEFLVIEGPKGPQATDVIRVGP
ncbi:MAG: cold shock domain-containing protein [Thermodesulfobacteriota bacterium]